MIVTNVTVSKKRVIDEGMAPYLEYLQTNFRTTCPQPANKIPFGMKEMASNEMFLSLTAQLGPEESVEDCISALVDIIDQSLDAHLGERQVTNTGDAFEVAVSKTESKEW